MTPKLYAGGLAVVLVAGFVGGLVGGAVTNGAVQPEPQTPTPSQQPEVVPADKPKGLPETISARRFLLVNEEGTVLAELGPCDTRNPKYGTRIPALGREQKPDQPILRFFDSQGRDAIWIGVNAVGAGGLSLFGGSLTPKRFRGPKNPVFSPACPDDWTTKGYFGSVLESGTDSSRDIRIHSSSGHWSPWDCKRHR